MAPIMADPAARVSDPHTVRPFVGTIDAIVTVPGSKSITNRALLCAALAEGPSRLEGVLFADDTEAMIGCISSMGASVTIDRAHHVVVVEGIAGRISDAPITLDARQSGTTARFIAATLVLAEEGRVLDADPQMRARPMGPTFDALRSMGAEVIELESPGHLPVNIRGTALDRRPTVSLPGDISSQFISGLLLVAPCLPNGLRLELSSDAVSAPYLDMTIEVMGAFGARVDHIDDRVFLVEPGGYRGCTYAVEPDASAASYFFAAAAICGGRVRIDGLGDASIQGDVGFVDVLAEMGAIVRRGHETITVEGASLHGVDVDLSAISDTAQTLAAVAAFATGETRARGIGFIRAKETDRLAAVVTELRRCGVGAEETADGFVITPAPVRPCVVQTYDDHRMAMSFALLGLRSDGIAIADPGCVSKTFPNYFEVLETLRPEQQ
jgi:3-phosphoshikimate 1-carboxyvinyltransferase